MIESKCPRCRTDWIGTPTEDGRRKCRNCGVVWRVTDGVRRITFDPRKVNVVFLQTWPLDLKP